MTEQEPDDAVYADTDMLAAEAAFLTWVDSQPAGTPEPGVIHAHLDGILHHLGVLQRDLADREALAKVHVDAATERALRFVDRGDLCGRIDRLRAQLDLVAIDATRATKTKTVVLPSGTIKTRTTDLWHWDDDEILLKDLVEGGHFGLIRPETTKTVPAAINKVAVKSTAQVVFNGDLGTVTIAGEILPMVTVEKSTTVEIVHAAEQPAEAF